MNAHGKIAQTESRGLRASWKQSSRATYNGFILSFVAEFPNKTILAGQVAICPVKFSSATQILDWPAKASPLS